MVTVGISTNKCYRANFQPFFMLWANLCRGNFCHVEQVSLELLPPHQIFTLFFTKMSENVTIKTRQWFFKNPMHKNEFPRWKKIQPSTEVFSFKFSSVFLYL